MSLHNIFGGDNQDTPLPETCLTWYEASKSETFSVVLTLVALNEVGQDISEVAEETPQVRLIFEHPKLVCA